MNDLYHGFEFISAYMDDILILIKGDKTDNIQKLSLTINKQRIKGLKYNIEKSFFRKTEMEYLGFWVTRYGIKPINRKIEVITNMKPPTSRKEVQNFMDVINYYRNMWSRRSHMSAPLTKLTSIKRNFKCTQA